MLTKSKKHIKISIEEWERLKQNPVLIDSIEILEDMIDLEKAQHIKGKNLTLDEYLKERKISSKD